MTLKSALYYWLTCDKCGAKSTEHSDFAAWSDASQAESEAQDSDWMVREDGHWCEDCSADLKCADCGEYEDAKGNLLTLTDGICPDCAGTTPGPGQLDLITGTEVTP